MSTLTLRGVRKSFGLLEVLHNVDLELEDGGFLVLLGPSGCGKSTLLSIIAGLEPASGGDVLIGERVVNDVHPKDRNIAMVFQSYALYPTMTVERNMGFGLEMRGVPTAERDGKVLDAARLLQVEHLLARKPGQLSGGQRQRVAMGRAIVRDPELFLFDEPLSNLDAKLRVEMRTEIKRLHDRLGTTVVYVTHDQVEAMTLGTRVAVMREGVIQQLADPQTIYDRPANMFVAGFIGSPAMNFISGVLEAGPGGPAFVYEAGRLRLSLPEPAMPRGVAMGRPVILGTRPEHLTLGSGSAARLSGTIDVVEPTGPDTMVVAMIGGQPVTARLPPRVALRPGEPVELAVDTSALNFFDPESGERL
ncbi:sn-glycerol-3-phosphate ABC transporter ATP-binding protein UgpC [Arsenicitalea aurantiaca]|uniref:sn-glycerol-3-phosphate ABC transporter ATP-binding protein UgpC n=1 Tax=Arsenicitalea aurantiaca TaxID=1783274 RepID=A0A433X5A6_9HYPH|nr:sn-glycerol-3-phosphate ABC transporter ATP-binding protein UgpC [Arsenicitalea aurantiaca]RUT29266.1 sn-glycerol-3-phosphate ABC transporter ATP-binding protein UgpC [Arsenicitalea aurantiaca]